MVLLLGWGQDLPCGHQAHRLPGNRGWKGKGCRPFREPRWPEKSLLRLGPLPPSMARRLSAALRAGEVALGPRQGRQAGYQEDCRNAT